MIRPVDVPIGRFTDYISAFKASYHRLDFEIELLALALLTKQHCFIQGPAGVAKSHLIRTFLSGIEGARVFSLQFGEGVTFEDLFGPVNHLIWRNEARIVHDTKGSIVEADFALLDEFLDAPPRVTRMLLAALNERRIIYGRWQKKLPLWSAFATTNFWSTDEKMKAVLDRFPIRHRMAAMTSPADFTSIATSGAAKAFRPPKLRFYDIQVLRRYVHDLSRKMGVPEPLADAAAALVRHKHSVSPRRFVAAQKALGAIAVLPHLAGMLPSLLTESGDDAITQVIAPEIIRLESYLAEDVCGPDLMRGMQSKNLCKAFCASVVAGGVKSKPELAVRAKEVSQEAHRKVAEKWGIPFDELGGVYATLSDYYARTKVSRKSLDMPFNPREVLDGVFPKKTRLDDIDDEVPF